MVQALGRPVRAEVVVTLAQVRSLRLAAQRSGGSKWAVHNTIDGRKVKQGCI